jgi:hypothetical protein
MVGTHTNRLVLRPACRVERCPRGRREDYAPLYKDSPKGRPSIPPSMVVLAMLLEYHDDCSNAEAEQRMRFDLRWKHALGLGLENEGFDATVLCRFRRKLLDRGLERALFERLVNAARGAGGKRREDRKGASLSVMAGSSATGTELARPMGNALALLEGVVGSAPAAPVARSA